MTTDPRQLGADGIVGVALTVRHGLMEQAAGFVAIGTGVRAEDNGRWRDNQNRPFTSALSGHEFWTLLQSGYAPVGLVLGACGTGLRLGRPRHRIPRRRDRGSSAARGSHHSATEADLGLNA